MTTERPPIPPSRVGPWRRRSRRDAYDERLDHGLARRGRPARRQPRHLRRRPLREPRRRRGRRSTTRIGSCSSASIATRSTRTPGRSPRAASRTASPPLDGARRELREETGVEADGWRELVPVPPVELDHRRGRRAVRGAGDEPRDRVARTRPRSSTIRWVPFDEALAMTADGRITDAMTIIGLQRARARAGEPAAAATRRGRR